VRCGSKQKLDRERTARWVEGIDVFMLESQRAFSLPNMRLERKWMDVPEPPQVSTNTAQFGIGSPC
jgi:hypothetical protein